MLLGSLTCVTPLGVQALGTGIDNSVKTWDASLLASRLLAFPNCCVIRVQCTNWYEETKMHTHDVYIVCDRDMAAGLPTCT
jgi:hypothetical protein